MTESEKLCAGIDERLRPYAVILADQMIVLSEKLQEARERIPDEDLVIEYDNGGGQKGTRENPFYPAYRRVLINFTRCFQVLAAMVKGTKAASDGTLDAFRKSLNLDKMARPGLIVPDYDGEDDVSGF